MIRILATVMFVSSFVFAKPVLVTKNPGQKRKSSSEYSYFADAKSDVTKVLSHSIFNSYTEYTIDNIRQGEIGEAQAYFVRLVKPFSADSLGMCFTFLGNSTLEGKPHACTQTE